MSQPFFPAPNPGGNMRKLIREAIAAGLTAQNIMGLDHVYPSRPVQWNWANYRQTGDDFACLIAVKIPDDAEDRTAYTGPTDRGGKMTGWQVTLEIIHRTFSPDDAQADDDLGAPSEDDYDRIIQAIKDWLHSARDLGRPDVVLHAGEYPRQNNIRHHANDLVTNGSDVIRNGFITFRAATYSVQYP